MLKFLQRQGFSIVRIKGSHHILAKDTCTVVVPVHGNQTLKIGTLNTILESSGIQKEEFTRLWKK